MKRVVSVSLLVIVICSLISFWVTAHSGKTDSNGGHYDHSTGEYHYHHGYPAHDHYDMDGDGRKDCPYKFDNKTNSGSNTSTSKPKNQKSGIDFWSVVIAILLLVPISLMSAWVLYMLFGMLMIFIQAIAENCFNKKISDNQRKKTTKILLVVGLVIEISIVFMLLLESL